MLGYADTERLLRTRYPRNTEEVEDALAQLLSIPPCIRAP